MSGSGTIYDGKYGADQDEGMIFKDLTDASVYTFNTNCDIVGEVFNHVGSIYAGSSDSPVYFDDPNGLDTNASSLLVCDIQADALTCSSGVANTFYYL